MARMAPVTPLLQARGLAKSFDGLQAVRPLDFAVERTGIRAIIGPNGAGKTTLVSMLSGRIRPTSGAVLFEDRDITRLAAWDRVALGIVYTFQVTSIFRKLTVYENVALAVQRRLMTRARHRIALRERTLAAQVAGALAELGLTEAGDRPAGSLPYGHQRLVEVAMGLALKPKVLILDEPTQGLAPDEITGFCQLIQDLSREVTILLIEHNIRVVLDLASTITVMDNGSIIAEGTPGEIEANPQVQQAYLGR